jgi:polyhydroxybutyrate depolymerase
MRAFHLVWGSLLLLACAPEHTVQGRAYELKVPAGAAADEALPLLILNHGYSANGWAQDVIFPFSKLVDSKRFLYALPNGTQDKFGKRFWNATDACCNFDEVPVDDVAFFRALIDDIKAQHPVKRVYVAGHSNGAFMALRLACEASDVIDGIVAVSGSTWNDFTRCPDGRKIPILLVHGTVDATIPYEGREGLYPAAHETGRRFARRAGCGETWSETGRADFVGDGDTETVQEQLDCDPAIQLWSIEGAGHVPSFDSKWTTASFDWLEAHAR